MMSLFSFILIDSCRLKQLLCLWGSISKRFYNCTLLELEVYDIFWICKNMLHWRHCFLPPSHLVWGKDAFGKICGKEEIPKGRRGELHEERWGCSQKPTAMDMPKESSTRPPRTAVSEVNSTTAQSVAIENSKATAKQFAEPNSNTARCQRVT